MKLITIEESNTVFGAKTKPICAAVPSFYSTSSDIARDCAPYAAIVTVAYIPLGGGFSPPAIAGFLSCSGLKLGDYVSNWLNEIKCISTGFIIEEDL